MKYKIVACFAMLAMVSPASAGWQDLLNDWLNTGGETPAEKSSSQSSSAYTPSTTDMNKAILDALQVGVKRAIELLGKQDGFLGDAQVRIPVPGDLQKVEKLLRKLGQDKYADRFITSMNRAAEQSVPQTTQIFIDSIKNIKVSDAQGIIKGGDDAATEYFRRTTSDKLQKVIRPLVSGAMDNAGVTRYYKKFIGKADFIGPYVNPETLDLDGYVTTKVIDGLFIKLAEEERLIRKDPAKRTTTLLKQVCGYFQ